MKAKPNVTWFRRLVLHQIYYRKPRENTMASSSNFMHFQVVCRRASGTNYLQSEGIRRIDQSLLSD